MSQSSTSTEPPQGARACGVEARVVSNTRICREHTLLEMRAPETPNAEPGQFLQILCNEPRRNAARETSKGRGVFLRRPISIADQWRAGDAAHIRIISRAVGPGTSWLEKLAPGDAVNITGPLGRGFRIPRNDVPAVLIGGGVGIPPLLFLARRLHEAGRRDVTAIFGAAARDLLPLRIVREPESDGSASHCVELPGDARYATSITTDDGSRGMRGVVTDALRLWTERRTRADLSRGVVFACGPDAMLRAIAETTRTLGLGRQLCIERNMGCGLGTCLSCVVRVADASRDAGWRWALTCVDGPVFDCDELRCWD